MRSSLRVGGGSCPGRFHLCSGDLRLSSLRADGKRPGHHPPPTQIPTAVSHEGVMKIPHLRWLMVSLIFLATVINYIDRQTVSVLKTSISTDLGLSNADYASIQNSFLLLYGISQMVSGRLYDRIGTRLGFVFSIVVWSGAAVAHAFAATSGMFKVFRGVLGFGEAGNWPGAAKVVGEWFPVKERALGMGIFNAGAALGSAVSPPIIAWLAIAYGWRSTFIVTGLLGFGWLVLWLLLFRVPEKHPWITDAERAYILADRGGPGCRRHRLEARLGQTARRTGRRGPWWWDASSPTRSGGSTFSGCRATSRRRAGSACSRSGGRRGCRSSARASGPLAADGRQGISFSAGGASTARARR